MHSIWHPSLASLHCFGTHVQRAHVILSVRQPIAKLQHKKYKYNGIRHRIKILRNRTKIIENSYTKVMAHKSLSVGVASFLFNLYSS
jgi:hypothetical protein